MLIYGHVSFAISLGMKDSMGPLKALVVASVINGVGDIVLCMFLGYGIAGAAWATAISQVCSVHLSSSFTIAITLFTTLTSSPFYHIYFCSCVSGL